MKEILPKQKNKLYERLSKALNDLTQSHEIIEEDKSKQIANKQAKDIIDNKIKNGETFKQIEEYIGVIESRSYSEEERKEFTKYLCLNCGNFFMDRSEKLKCPNCQSDNITTKTKTYLIKDNI